MLEAVGKKRGVLAAGSRNRRRTIFGHIVCGFYGYAKAPVGYYSVVNDGAKSAAMTCRVGWKKHHSS